MERFKRLGPKVEHSESAISYEDALEFQKIAFIGARMAELALSDSEMVLWMATGNDGILSDASGDYDVAAHSVFSKSIIGTREDYWQSTIAFARYRQSNRGLKIYNIYKVWAVEGEVAEAVRQVRVIRKLSRISFDKENTPFEDIYRDDRNYFEVPMKPENIEKISDDVQRLVARNRATSGH